MIVLQSISTAVLPPEDQGAEYVCCIADVLHHHVEVVVLSWSGTH